MDNREGFEQWAYQNDFDVLTWSNGKYNNGRTVCAAIGWNARQPEIDALNNALIAEQDHNADMVAEVINLKTEVERLRKNLRITLDKTE